MSNRRFPSLFSLNELSILIGSLQNPNGNLNIVFDDNLCSKHTSAAMNQTTSVVDYRLPLLLLPPPELLPPELLPPDPDDEGELMDGELLRAGAE